MSNGTYTNHYKKYLAIYEELAEANGGKTVWIPTDAHDGWYVSTPVDNENSEAWKQGYPMKSQPSILPDDLSPEVERTAYTTISYAPDEAYKPTYFKETEDGVEWLNNDSKRLPDYDELVAWALFVDIDIDKNYKQRPIPEEHKEIIEQRLDLWVKAFAAMAGGIDHVQVLDSGGGMYVFVPPTALSPVADRYDHEERGLIFNEIGKRMRTVTGKLDDLICSEDDAPQELFSADKVQNKNRQFKTLGAIHKDLDAVVHPRDPENISVTHKRMSDISDDDIEDAMEWAENFTSDTHRECVENVIEYLFQGKFTKRDDVDLDSVNGKDWKEILDTWVEEKIEALEAWKTAQEEREKISDERLRTELTQDRDVAQEAVRRVNNRKLKQYIIKYLGAENVYEKSGSEEMDFFPFWRAGSTESGRSAFYDFYEGQARFTDKADGTSRDIVYWVALEMTHDDKNYPNTKLIESPGESLSGSDYRRAIQELRDRGEDIPVLVPEVDEEETLSEWQIRQIGEEVGIVSSSDIVELDGNKKLKPDAWNAVLERLDKEDIIHNQEQRTFLKSRDISPPNTNELTEEEAEVAFYDNKAYSPEPFDSTEEYDEFLSSLPDHIVAFEYDGEIAGGPADGILAGAFISQDNENVTPIRIEPYPIQMINSIQSHNDLTIETSDSLDKTQMTVLIPSDSSYGIK